MLTANYPKVKNATSELFVKVKISYDEMVKEYQTITCSLVL